ncbi:hypothetical protein BHM03_00058112 [Ensete ventricosum]|uniref:Uncharacterized protein n=1 Tax=Ensete ventricosum TaxID=4639 RepID=A0A445MMJ8_ENSVE|nr:hypothetical protein BHM03_00058112 [Ensete ventricosum]
MEWGATGCCPSPTTCAAKEDSSRRTRTHSARRTTRRGPREPTRAAPRRASELPGGWVAPSHPAFAA